MSGASFTTADNNMNDSKQNESDFMDCNQSGDKSMLLGGTIYHDADFMNTITSNRSMYETV